MLTIRGLPTDLRQGFTRRDLLRITLGAGFAWPSALALGSEQRQLSGSPARSGSFGKAKSCIFLYLFGGPSHIDIWDLKPAAPPEIRGEFKPMATNVPGLQITELLPRLARQMDKCALIRSMSHGDSAHGSSAHAMLTGRLPRVLGEVPPTVDDFPHYGSVLSRLRPPKAGIPPFVALPWTVSTSTNVLPGQNAGFLGRAMDPFRLELPPDQSLYFAPPLTNLPNDINAARLQGRRTLQTRLPDSLRQDAVAKEMGTLYDRAFSLLTAPQASHAFQLDREPPTVRERYGMNVFGQSVLLARRLVEAGVPAITVYWPDRKEPEAFNNNGVQDSVAVPAWDTHGKKVGNTPNFPALRDRLLPPLDLAVTALLEDLSARGLLDETLVIVTGEFGRTPRMNRDAGRDHYGNVFSVLLSGGGIHGGQVYGSSDKIAAFPADNPVSPGALAATLYHCLGLPAETVVYNRLNQPIHIAEGVPVTPLLV